MKPDNQTERKKAILKFILLYGVSIIAVFFAGFLLFQVPLALLKGNLAKLINESDEQNRLTERVSNITPLIQKISSTDETYAGTENDNTRAKLLSNLQDYQKTYMDSVSVLKSDTAKAASGTLEANLKNYVVAFDAIKDYRYLINDLRSKIKDLNTNNTSLTSQNEVLKSQPQVSAPPPAAGGGGGGGDDNSKKMLDQCRVDLSQAQSRLRASESKVQNAEANALFKAATNMVSNARSIDSDRKQGMLYAAKLLFESAREAGYDDSQKINQSILEVKRLLQN